MAMPGQASHASNVGRLEHRDADEHRPRSGEEVAEALADRDAEVAVEGVEDDRRRLAGRRARARDPRRLARAPARGRASARARGTARRPRGRRSSSSTGTICEAVAGEHLAEQHGERREQDCRQHEAVPESFSRTPPAWNRLRMSPAGLRSTAG